MAEIKEKKIYTRKLAYILRCAGFSILRTEPNPKKPQFDIYVFAATPEFEEYFIKIAGKKNIM